MNGYQDRVRRHRRELAEAEARREQEMTSGMDWIGDCVEGVTNALESVRVHRRRTVTDDGPAT